MAPDLNSLPPSTSDLRSSSTAATRSSMSSHGAGLGSPQNGDGDRTPSPRSTNLTGGSLQAAATVNAGLQRDESARRSSSTSNSRSRQSPAASRRRSQVLMNLQINDPAIPAPGEMLSELHVQSSSYRTSSPQPLSGSPLLIASSGDPHHNRAPSLGELHQELENEQEFQVNRLLQEIRRLQMQVQRQGGSGQSQPATTGDEASDRSVPLGPVSSNPGSSSAPQSAHPLPRSPGFPHHPRSSFDMARADLQRRSRTPSRGASPRLRSTSISAESGPEQWTLGGGARDESTFYQAETQMLIRENQMLRHRIRELERQLSESSPGAAASGLTHEPSQHSHLMRSTTASDEDAGASSTRATAPSSSVGLPAVADAPKEE